MKRHWVFLWSVIFVAAHGLVPAHDAWANERLTISEKATLQAVMQQHIERLLIDGVYLQMDWQTGEVRELHPLAAHPTILRFDNNFVLCSDFQDNDGSIVNVDFYVAPRASSYVVFQSVVDDREQLKRLMRLGKVVPTN